MSGNISQTCRFFGVSLSLYYIWKKRFEKKGLDGLRDLKRRLNAHDGNGRFANNSVATGSEMALGGAATDDNQVPFRLLRKATQNLGNVAAGNNYLRFPPVPKGRPVDDCEPRHLLA